MYNDEELEIEEEIVSFRNTMINNYCNMEALNKMRNDLIERKAMLSFAWIVYRVVRIIDLEMIKIYREEKKLNTIYKRLEQWEWDDVFEACIKANRLGLVVYPLYNVNNDLSYLKPDDEAGLLEVLEESINKYFDFLLDKNIKNHRIMMEFINKMTKFGENHDMSEEEVTQFARRAFEMGINVIGIKSQDELDEVYRRVCPEA